MSLRAVRAVPAILLLAGLAGQAAAHTKSASYSNWRIDGTEVHLSFTVPLIETARLNEPGETQPPNERIEDYLVKRLNVSADGKACLLTASPKPLTPSSSVSAKPFFSSASALAKRGRVANSSLILPSLRRYRPQVRSLPSPATRLIACRVADAA